jgi:hypothetical protein
MASTSAQEEFLAVTRKSQEAVIAVIRTLAEPLRAISPKLPSVSVPFADKLPGPGDAVDRTYDFAEQLLASQRKFTEDLLKATAPLMPGRAESAPATETYKPGQIVPLDGTVECTRHPAVQDQVKAGTRFAPCSHHHEHSEGCTWQYVEGG